MLSKILILIYLMVLVSACSSKQVMSPETARAMLTAGWQIDQHIVWEIDWPAAPVGGPLTVETWRADERYRFEILESVAPALVGETLIFDGQQAWRYNRFAAELPDTPSSPVLSPVSDALAMIDQLLATPPQTATQQSGQTIHGPAQKIVLSLENGDRLIMWRDEETQLPVQILFSVRGRQATLKARRFEPLADPPSRLFELGD